MIDSFDADALFVAALTEGTSAWPGIARNLLACWKRSGHAVTTDWREARACSKSLFLCADSVASDVGQSQRRYRAAPFTVWHTSGDRDPVPKDIVNALQGQRVAVPSTHNQQVYKRSGIDSVVIPHGFDPDVHTDRYARIALFADPPRFFRFLFVGNGRMRRKGLDILLRAIPMVKDENARFLIHGPVTGAHYVMGKDPRIMWDPTDLPDDRMGPLLYRNADCFVTATRGEGFGLPVLEAMANGLPVIAPRFGGYLDFANDDNAVLVPAEEKFVEWESGEQVRGCEVAPEALAEAMTRMMQDPRRARDLGTRAAASMSHLTWQSAADKLWELVHA